MWGYILKINEIKNGETVFIDANIFVYFLVKQRVYYEDCLNLFTRIEEGKLTGFVNQFVLAEVLFSITNHQIITKNKLKANEVVRFVKNNPVLSKKSKDIKNITTNDSDFEQVPFLKVWKP